MSHPPSRTTPGERGPGSGMTQTWGPSHSWTLRAPLCSAEGPLARCQQQHSMFTPNPKPVSLLFAEALNALTLLRLQMVSLLPSGRNAGAFSQGDSYCPCAASEPTQAWGLDPRQDWSSRPSACFSRWASLSGVSWFHHLQPLDPQQVVLVVLSTQGLHPSSPSSVHHRLAEEETQGANSLHRLLHSWLAVTPVTVRQGGGWDFAIQTGPRRQH